MSDPVARRFQQVDVFGIRPLAGNPVAVVLDGEGLTTEEMLAFTRWTNLSEATFLLPPTTPAADYRVRIFAPTAELPFAGHPTLGSCHAWLAAGGRPRRPGVVVQECGSGLVDVRTRPDGLAFAEPPLLRSGPVEPVIVERLPDLLGLPAHAIVDTRWVDNGPGWVGVLLPDVGTLRGARLGAGADLGHGAADIGLVAPRPPGDPCAFEVRALFTDHLGQPREDPVTGSLHASLGRWLLDTGRATAPYTASQGAAVGHDGRVRVELDPSGGLWVGGATTTCITGEVHL